MRPILFYIIFVFQNLVFAQSQNESMIGSWLTAHAQGVESIIFNGSTQNHKNCLLIFGPQSIELIIQDNSKFLKSSQKISVIQLADAPILAEEKDSKKVRVYGTTDPMAGSSIHVTFDGIGNIVEAIGISSGITSPKCEKFGVTNGL